MRSDFLVTRGRKSDFGAFPFSKFGWRVLLTSLQVALFSKISPSLSIELWAAHLYYALVGNQGRQHFATRGSFSSFRARRFIFDTDNGIGSPVLLKLYLDLFGHASCPVGWIKHGAVHRSGHLCDAVGPDGTGFASLCGVARGTRPSRMGFVVVVVVVVMEASNASNDGLVCLGTRPETIG